MFGYAAAWLLVRFAYVRDVARLPDRRYEPVGVLGWAARPSPTVVTVGVLVTLAACAAAAVGYRVRLAAPAGAIGMLLVATFTSSFGQVFHTEHVLVLHLLVLAVAALVETPSADRELVSAWPLTLMTAVLGMTYVVAGVAKLRWSGWSWVTGDVLRDWVAIDNLRKVLVHDLHSPLGGWMSSVGWIWPPIAVLTLAVELGAPSVFVAWRARLIWCAAAWAFHVGVLVVMAISFPYQLLGVAYACALPVERYADRVASMVGRRPRATSVRRSAWMRTQQPH